MSAEIADDEERWRWEKENANVMNYLLEAKAKQCEIFKNCLLENKDKVLAEATKSMIWGTGLSPYVTTHTAPNYWPGKNWLGGMLTELTQKLIHEDANIESEGDVNDVIEVEMEAADSDHHDHTADLNLQNVDETVDELGGTDHDFNEHTSNAVSLSSDVPTDESNAEAKGDSGASW